MITKVMDIGGNKTVVDEHNLPVRRVAEYYGKSTDAKPVAGVKDADIFCEKDTGKVFLFDEDTSAWLEQ